MNNTITHHQQPTLPLVDLYKLMKLISDRVDGALILTLIVNKEELFDRIDFEVTLSWMYRGVPTEVKFIPADIEHIMNNNDNKHLNNGVYQLFRDAVEWAVGSKDVD